jgi:DNA-binding MarR family transcriptional regulator
VTNFLDQFDETIHAPRRLAICAFLATVDEADFATVRDSLSISDSSLSKQVRILADAGYIVAQKVVSGGRARSWLRLTAGGRAAFAAHVERLRRILELQA